MARWKHRIALRHLFTKKEDLKSVQESMKAIADEIKKAPFFRGFDVKKFYTIPAGDDVISPLDYANKLLERMWDFCDEHGIWIEF